MTRPVSRRCHSLSLHRSKADDRMGLQRLQGPVVAGIGVAIFCRPITAVAATASETLPPQTGEPSELKESGCPVTKHCRLRGEERPRSQIRAACRSLIAQKGSP